MTTKPTAKIEKIEKIEEPPSKPVVPADVKPADVAPAAPSAPTELEPDELEPDPLDREIADRVHSYMQAVVHRVPAECLRAVAGAIECGARLVYLSIRGDSIAVDEWRLAVWALPEQQRAEVTGILEAIAGDVVRHRLAWMRAP